MRNGGGRGLNACCDPRGLRLRPCFKGLLAEAQIAEVPSEARFLKVEAVSGLADDVLEATDALRRLVDAVQAHRLGFVAKGLHNAQERRACLFESRGNHGLRAGDFLHDVLQVAVTRNAPRVEALDDVGLGHADHEAGAQNPRHAGRGARCKMRRAGRGARYTPGQSAACR